MSLYFFYDGASTDVVGALRGGDLGPEVDNEVLYDGVTFGGLDGEFVTGFDAGQAGVGNLAVDGHHAAVAELVAAGKVHKG
ncbi:MAG: hypothetical protein V1915_03030 [Candidatus Bathyarchaeota archaeon]